MAGPTRSFCSSLTVHAALLTSLGLALGSGRGERRLQVHLAIATEEACEAEVPVVAIPDAEAGIEEAQPEPVAAEIAPDLQGEPDPGEEDPQAPPVPATEEPREQGPSPASALARLAQADVPVRAPRVPASPPLAAQQPAPAIVALEGSNRAPGYPAVARKRGWQGVVVLAIEVDATGRVTAVGVRVGSGHAVLDVAARDAVLDWRFVGGPGSTEVTIRFVLEART